MKRGVWLGAAAAAAALLVALFSPQSGRAQQTAPVNVRWNTQSVVQLTLTPNYYSAFGAQRATTLGTPPPIQHGPDATGVGQGAVDFGQVFTASQYIYRYAAQVHVQTNDASGYFVYGEGTANFYNQSDGTSLNLNQTLYWLNSGATSSPNNGFSGGFPFQVTGGLVSPAQPNFATAPTITYGTYPTPIVNSTTASGDNYYDYILKIPAVATGGNYFVWVVYTVVAK